MEHKFTPGPWRELVTRIDDARGYQICHLDLHGKSEAERDANRRLIAAAPDLLKALIAMREAFWGTSHNADEDAANELAKSAISKATES